MGKRATGFGWLSLGAAVLLVGSVAAGAAAGEAGAQGEAGVEQAPACGGPGQPACPLQGFMRASVATPLAANDMAALAAGLDRAARLSPDASWSSWAGFATAGAEAARRGDVAKARAACKGCHEAWREAYRARHRARPLPR